VSSKARFIPWVITWITVLMSARVWDWLPPNAKVDPAAAIFTFAGVPLLALAVTLIGQRAEQTSASKLGRASALLLSWVITFLAAVHAMVLAQAIGKLDSVLVAMPPAIGVFFLGLGPLLAMLEPGSPMGIRTKATLGDSARWRKTHLVLGVLFAISGGLGIAASALGLDVQTRLGAAVVPGVLALIVAIAYGSASGSRA
jgi:hypothetical protein